MRKFLSLLMMALMAVSLSAKTIYLNTGGSGLWNQAGAVFFAHSWGSADSDQLMTLVEGDVFQAEVPDGNTSIVFVRMAPGSTAIDWNNKWNQSADQTIPADKNYFTLTDWSNGSWSVYTPASEDGDAIVLTFNCYNSTSGDKNNSESTLAGLFDEASLAYVDAEAEKTLNKVYLGRKYKDGNDSIFSNLKLGSSSVVGELKFTLANPTEVDSIVFRAAMYASNEGGDGFSVNGTAFTLSAGKLNFENKVWKPTGEVSSIDIVQTKANKGRFFLTSITIYPKAGETPEPPVITYETLKLVPGVWATDEAKMAAYVWGENITAGWTAFFAGAGDTLSAEINAAADSMVLVRFNSSVEAPTWDNEGQNVWNKIDKIEIDHAGLVYTVTDWSAGQWDPYVAPEPPVITYETLKLVPGVWTTDEAKMAAYVWGENITAGWTAFFAGAGDTLSAEINAAADSMVLVRFNSSVEAPTWDNEGQNVWNKIDKIEIDHAGLVYTVTDWSAGQWDPYVAPEPPVQDPTVEAWGSMNDWAEAIPFTLSADKTYATLTVPHIGADQYEFKLKENGEWRGINGDNNTSYWFTRTNPNAAGLSDPLSKNMTFEADQDGEYTFTWFFANDSLAITYPEAIEPVEEWYLVGDMTEWEAAKVEFVEGVVKANLDEVGRTYAFKILKVAGNAKTWYGNDGTMTHEYHENWDFSETVDANCMLTADAAGEYTFHLILGEGVKVTVDFPNKTDIDNVNAAVEAVKIIRDGQLLIIKGEKTYTIMGQLVK